MKDNKIKLDSQKEKYLASVKKKKKLPLILLIVSVCVAAALVGYFIFGKGETSNKSTGAKKGDQVRRLIDGVWDSAENQNKYPVAIMVENLVTVRPQSGLDKANIIYEALVEGGITRFMLVYTLADVVESIGPVRSARPYYLDWTKEYNALYGHVGGSPKAMSLISTYDIFNLDQFYDAKYYWRDSERAAPHNVYTASKFLIYALRDKEAPAEASFESYKFKEDATLQERPEEEKTITIDYSSFSYKVEYKYNRENNTYLRYQGGKPFEVRDVGHIAAKNVVVQYVETSLEDASRLTMETIGTGKAVVFIDGMAQKGTWEKEGRNTRTMFYDEEGGEMTFNAGQTWIQIVPTDREITYN